MSVDFDPNQIAIPKGHFIDGAFLDLPGEAIEVLRPSDHQPIEAIRDGGEAAVERAVEAARRALATTRWGRISPLERAKVLHRFADAVEANGAYLARLEALGSSRLVAATSGARRSAHGAASSAITPNIATSSKASSPRPTPTR